MVITQMEYILVIIRKGSRDVKQDVKFSTSKIGKAYVTNSQLMYFEKKYRENLNMQEYPISTGKGCIFNGQAGSGKTTKLCQMVQKCENPLVLSFTNKAVGNVKKRLIKLKYDKDKTNDICFTFDSYFCEWKNRDIESLKDKTIFLEEFSMIPNKWITLIYKAFTMFSNKVYMFGDPNQCSPVEDGSQINYDYLRSHTIREMCPKIETLEYTEDSCRYDKQTHEILQKFLKHGKISAFFQPTNNKLLKNICYLNSTRTKVNTECCNIFTKNKEHIVVNFKYNNKREEYKVCEKMPVIATTNIKDKEIFNTAEYKIQEIDETEVMINNEWYGLVEFSESFVPSFCVTVYKYQGADINEPYNIHDVNRMDKKQLYTALSRTTKLEYIHFNNRELNNIYFIRKQPFLELIKSKFNSLYKNGKIQVTFDDGKVYVGSTCETLETRLKWHLSNPKSQVYKDRKKNPKIELIIDAPSKDKRSLENSENGHIQEHAEKYGDLLLNKRMNPKAKKVVEYKVNLENEEQLRERIAKLDKKIVIRDDVENRMFFYDTSIDGRRYVTKARYGKQTRDSALMKINCKKQKLIKELTIHYE